MPVYVIMIQFFLMLKTRGVISLCNWMTELKWQSLIAIEILKSGFDPDELS